MPEHRDDDLAKLVLERGRATPEQVAEAKKLAAKMRELGLEKDVLDALAERGLISGGEAASIRSGESGEVKADSETLKVAPDPFAPAPEARPAPTGSGRPSHSQLPPCANHPHMPGIYKCAVCGRSICMQCGVRTSKGIYCSQECMAAVSLARGAAAGTGGSAERLRVKQIAFGAAVVAVGALVVIWAARPSAKLSRARELKAGIERLEGEKRQKEALALAEDLATIEIATGGGELWDLVEWGDARVGTLRLEVAQAELDGLREGRPDIGKLDPPDLVRYKQELHEFAARRADIPAASRAAKGLAARIEARLAQIEKDHTEAAVGASHAAANTALEEATKEAEALMAKSRYGDALAAVERRRSEVPGRLGPEFREKLDSLKKRITSEARSAYRQKELAAKTLVWKRRYGEAQKIFRDVIETFGIDEITRQARASLEKVYTVQVTTGGAAKQDDPGRAEEAPSESRPALGHAEAAARRGDLDRVDRALAVVEERLKALDYVGAMLEIEVASPDVRQEEAAERLETIAEGVRCDEEAFLAILEMIRKKPVKLARIRREALGEIADADSNRYTVRMGESSYKMPWRRMPAREICSLAEMAAGDDIDSLVNLALFCAGRGSYAYYLKARGRIKKSARAGEDPLARFEMRFERLKRKGGGVRAPGASRGKTEPSGKDAGDLEITATGKKGIEPPQAPEMIDVECPYCKGAGTLTSRGCGKCRATGIDGSGRCQNCAASGRVKAKCPNCRGQGFLMVDGRGHECPICKGKGRPRCLFCKGSGKIKVSNPDAAPGPTVTCPYCNGLRYDAKVKCKSCSGSGRKIFYRTDGIVRWSIQQTCTFCAGKGEGPPLCPVCSGKGYVGSSDTPKLCRRCLATGHVYSPCRACRGRGWILMKKKKR